MLPLSYKQFQVFLGQSTCFSLLEEAWLQFTPHTTERTDPLRSLRWAWRTTCVGHTEASSSHHLPSPRPPPQSQVTERRVSSAFREREWLSVFPQYLLFQRRSQQRWSPAFALSAAKENTTYLVPASVFSFKTFTFNIYFEENFLEHPLSFNYLSCLFSKCKLPTVSCQSLLPFNMDISNSWSVCF